MLDPNVQALVRAQMRKKLEREEREQRQELEKTFDTIAYHAQKAETSGLPSAKFLFNVGLHLLLAERDIQAVKIDALTHEDEWKRKLSARIIILTIVEWDTDKITGQNLRLALDELATP